MMKHSSGNHADWRPALNNVRKETRSFLRLEPVSRGFYYGALLAAFVVAFFGAYLVFFLEGKSLVWSWDGVVQHYPNLEYTREWIEGCISALSSGQEIPQWDLTIGLGQDFLNSFSFRPLNLLCVFFPGDMLELYFWIRQFICLLLGAIFFSVFIRKLKGCYDLPILLGAVSFVFCGISMAYFTRHAIFSELLFYTPIFLLAVEKVLRDESSAPLVVTTFFCAVSYFYNLYSLCIVGVAYALIRLKSVANDDIPILRFGIKKFLSCFGWILLGIGLAGFALLPNLYLALTSGRSGSGSISILYGIKYYYHLLLSPISPKEFGVYGYIGVPGVITLSVMLLYITPSKKTNKQVKIALTVAILSMLFPFFASLMNGFAGLNNRFSMMLAFAGCGVEALCLKDLISSISKSSKKRKAALLAVVAAYLLFIDLARIFSDDGQFARISALVVCVFAVFLLGKGMAKQPVVGVLLALTISEICIQGYSFYSSDSMGIADEYVRSGKVTDAVREQTAQVLKDANIDDIDLYRSEILTRSEAKTRDSNYGFRTGLNGVSTYFSYSPSSIVEGSADLGNSQTHALFRIFDFDQRSGLNALSAVKYTSVEPGARAKLVKGAKLMCTINGYYIYENESALPLLYAYDDAIPESKFQSLDEHDKEWSMLQAIAWDSDEVEDVASLYHSSIQLLDANGLREAVATAIEKGNAALRLSDNGIVVSRPTKLTISLDVPEDSELYAEFENLEFIPTGSSDAATMYIGSGDTSDRLTLLGEGNQYATDARNVLANIGYSSEQRTGVTILFETAGEYSFTDFSLAYQPMNRFESMVDDIIKATDISVEGNSVSGRVSMDEDGYACLAIPFSEGWRATVDGEAVQVHKANEMYMGIEVPAGTHEIRFTYHTVFLTEGILLSCASVAVACGIIFARIWYKATGKQNEPRDTKLTSRLVLRRWLYHGKDN